MIGDVSYKIERGLRALVELLGYSLQRPSAVNRFWIVSCTRNVGAMAVKCLDSVHCQDYPGERFRHLFIDDASNDGTSDLIAKWLQDNPGHHVEYQRNETRLGGTANTVHGFRAAPPGSIVLELNGDDWLPDSQVLAFLNKVYADPAVWMTYNSYMFPDGRVAGQCRPYPGKVVRENSFRQYQRWVSSHLHSFRAELFSQLRDDTFIDPETGRYWESADDMAIYLAMLELSGRHARHLYRVNYVYNYHEGSHEAFEADQSLQRVRRIRAMVRYSPLERLPRGRS